MPILAFTGNLGSGKTLGLTLYGFLFQQYTGLPVYSNYPVSFARRLGTYDQLYSLRTAVVLLDELQVMADSREFAKKSVKELTQWVLQTRKLSLFIMGTSQRLNQVDLRIRRLVDLAIVCHKFGSRGGWRTRFTYAVPDMFVEDQWVKVGTQTLPHSSWMYQLYDTYQVVEALQ